MNIFDRIGSFQKKRHGFMFCSRSLTIFAFLFYFLRMGGGGGGGLGGGKGEKFCGGLALPAGAH